MPWSNGERAAPMAIRRTLESAVRREAGTQAGGTRAIGQWARRGVAPPGFAHGEAGGAGGRLPRAVREGGGRAGGGLPGGRRQAGAERGPGPRAKVAETRLDALG